MLACSSFMAAMKGPAVIAPLPGNGCEDPRSAGDALLTFTGDVDKTAAVAQAATKADTLLIHFPSPKDNSSRFIYVAMIRIQ
jgi:hypothetical protein